MPFTTLSSVVQARPSAISSSLEKLSCSAAGIDEIDIYPAVLSALTAKAAPRTVADEVRAFMHTARSHHKRNLQGDPRTQMRASSSSAAMPAAQEDSYTESFNVGIAMSLHTVLLSRNRIRSLLGVVQFKHCVRLSLLGNRIGSLEDCEPLAMLPDLQYLSLEFNPVTQLPHYRAHLLRICAWPHELSSRTCRLRKLDSTAVTQAEVKHAVLCLQREQTLLPELLYRLQLLAFLNDMEKRSGVHRELRQRGFVFQCAAETAASLEATLERGAAYALGRVPVSGAAHLVRRLVRDRHRLLATAPGTADRPQSQGEGEGLSRSPAAPSQTAPNRNATATFVNSNQLDTSSIASVSSVASCSFFTDQSEGDAQVLHSLSSLLEAKKLDWSQAALHRADGAAASETCREWSRDAFRQTLAFLDVRVCAVLLRIARALGQSLNAQDVDHLCQVWLHCVTHFVAVEESSANVTGPRRFVVTRDAAAAAPQTKLTIPRASARTSCIRPSDSATAAMKSLPHSASRLPAETAAQVSKTVWQVGERDGSLSHSAVSSLSAVLCDMSEDACASISTASLSSDSILQPRKTIPLPTAATRDAPRRTWQPEEKQWPSAAWKESGSSEPRSSPSPLVAVQQEKKTLVNDNDNDEDGDLPSRLLAAEKLLYRRAKQRVFQQWYTSLRHRWQSRIVVAYIRHKIGEAAVLPRASQLRSPSWSALLKHVTYIERKRGYFLYWRRRAEARQAARRSEVERVAGVWNAHSTEVSSLSSLSSVVHAPHCQDDTCAAEERRRSARVAFSRWKAKAEEKALSRCKSARQRVLVESPHTPETLFSVHPRSFIARQSADDKLPSSLPVVSRHVLRDLLKAATNNEGAAASTSPSPSRLRRCNVVQDAPVKVSVWQSPSPKAALAGATDVAACATTDDDDGAGLSPVAPSSSDGVSVSSVTSPFLFEPHASETEADRQAANSGNNKGDNDAPNIGRCPPSRQVLRELSPPPAIRILFPPDTTAKRLGSSSSPSVAAMPAAATTAITGKSALRFYGSSQPSRLPSTTAARRAIITCSQTTSQNEPTPRRDRPQQESANSPYPVEDVEALVARAAQLEADRVFLLSKVSKLSTTSGHLRDPRSDRPELATTTPSSTAGTATRTLAQDNAEDLCMTQQREIRRLESIVAALRDERYNLLKSVKTEIFQY